MVDCASDGGGVTLLLLLTPCRIVFITYVFDRRTARNLPKAMCHRPFYRNLIWPVADVSTIVVASGPRICLQRAWAHDSYKWGLYGPGKGGGGFYT